MTKPYYQSKVLSNIFITDQQILPIFVWKLWKKIIPIWTRSSFFSFALLSGTLFFSWAFIN